MSRTSCRTARLRVGDVADIDLGHSASRCQVGAYLSTGGGDAEHRPMTAAFVHFTGADDLLESEGPDALADALETCLGTVQRIAHDHGVTFFETDIAPDGGKIMLMAGAPSSAGNDEERMLRATRAVLDDEPSLPMRIGVNQGRIFAGDFGPPFRRTYSVKGDAVNLAARVMARAEPGSCSPPTTVLDRSPHELRDAGTAALPGEGQVRARPGVRRRQAAPRCRARRRDRSDRREARARHAARAASPAPVCPRAGWWRSSAEPGMASRRCWSAELREAPDVRSPHRAVRRVRGLHAVPPLHGLLRSCSSSHSTRLARGSRPCSRAGSAPEPLVPLIGDPLGLEASGYPRDGGARPASSAGRSSRRSSSSCSGFSCSSDPARPRGRPLARRRDRGPRRDAG